MAKFFVPAVLIFWACMAPQSATGQQVKGVVSPDKKIRVEIKKTTILLYENATGKLLSTETGHTEKITALAFSADSKLLASAGGDETIRIWNANGGGAKKVIRDAPAGVTELSFSKDGRTLIALDSAKKTHRWETDSGKRIEK